jgi:hypothetical protein
MIKLNEVLDTLNSLLNELNADKIYFSEINENVTKKIQANENKINYCIDLLTQFLNDSLKENKTLKNDFKHKNELINKLELILILYGIDEFNYYLKMYSFSELLEIVKENRENKIIRLPVYFREIKPRYLFSKNKTGKLIFAGKI